MMSLADNRRYLTIQHVRALKFQGHVSMLPLVNLFLALIPFLLLCANLSPLASLQIDTPRMPAAASGSGIALHIKATLWRVQALVNHEAQSLSTNVPREQQETRPAKRSYELLGAALYRIKHRYPQTSTVVVHPDSDITYDEVLETIDALRSLRSHEAEHSTPLFDSVILGAGGVKL